MFLRKEKKAHYLRPVLGNQPSPSQALGALPWAAVPVEAATSEISHGRIETRTIRVLPLPDGITMEGARQAILIERHVTYRKKRQWRTRCEAVLYITSLAPDEATPEGLTSTKSDDAAPGTASRSLSYASNACTTTKSSGTARCRRDLAHAPFGLARQTTRGCPARACVRPGQRWQPRAAGRAAVAHVDGGAESAQLGRDETWSPRQLPSADWRSRG
jgi:hypothetical protein